MSYLLATLCTIIMVAALFLIILSLPGNWVIVIVSALWAFFSDAAFGWQFFAVIIGLAVAGEVLEFMAGAVGGQKFGGTKKGSLGGIIGALICGIIGAGFFFGLGALPGAMIGGFLGSFIFEILHGMGAGPAAKAAFGTMLGRFGGFLAKFGIGIALLWLTIPRIWGSIGSSIESAVNTLLMFSQALC
ncbi:DUF456 domain-containing protein [Desulfovibrio sp. OttesenSCG-928-F07]|nr:DUF456 domain-containing protein [Desulfovibrio sp. OttesenSCG-928-F07]